jgi:hypothetical protein
MDSPNLVVAHFSAQYLLTIHYDPASIPHSYNETSWRDANSNVQLGPAQSTIDLSSVERLRFLTWVEDGGNVGGISINVLMDTPHDVTLSYATQYYVDVRSSYDSVSGSGWYDKGSTARITASTTSGSWPLAYALSGWTVTPTSGKLGFDNGAWTLTVDRPYVVEAVWNFDVFPVLALIAGISIAIVAVVGIMLAYRRRMFSRGTRPLQPVSKASGVGGEMQICGTCGTRIPKGATFCQKCGAPTTAAERNPLEDKVYDYIVKHEGVISISKASEDLGITAEQLKQASEALKKKGRLA